MLKKILIITPLVIVGALIALYFFLNQESESQLDLFIEQAIASGAYQDISYDTVAVGVNGALTITNLSLTDPQGIQYDIDELVVSSFDFLNPFPHYINISASGISFPEGIPAHISTGNNLLDSYLHSTALIEGIPLVVNYQHQYDPADNHALESNISMSLSESARLSFSSSTRNMPYENLPDMNINDAQSQAELARLIALAEIPELSLSLEDRGLVEDLLIMQSGNTGQSLEQTRSQNREMLRLLVLFVPESLQNLTLDLIAELNSFLDGGKTFDISLRPDYDGSIQSLQPIVLTAIYSGDYPALVDVLNPDFSTR